jgi:hypothetical protein
MMMAMITRNGESIFYCPRFNYYLKEPHPNSKMLNRKRKFEPLQRYGNEDDDDDDDGAEKKY